MVGGDLNVLKGKQVLEAGCGAGRFTEILLQSGADVQATDLSIAVEANYDNFNQYKNYTVCQSSILEPPYAPEQFDFVICVGVIQATPDPEETIMVLASLVKPGGQLVIDIYSYDYPATASRRFLRQLLLNKPGWLTLNVCRMLVALLWPLHRGLRGLCRWTNLHLKPPQLLKRSGRMETFWLENIQDLARCSKLYAAWVRLSPLVDYQDSYPQLGNRLLRAWAILDMHDTVTDVYKHFRSQEEIVNHLESLGLEIIEAGYGGNGVEARAFKPIQKTVEEL
jgi:SAM-dependent methyltransferase